jgi:hypothetical protein
MTAHLCVTRRTEDYENIGDRNFQHHSSSFYSIDIVRTVCNYQYFILCKFGSFCFPQYLLKGYLMKTYLSQSETLIENLIGRERILMQKPQMNHVYAFYIQYLYIDILIYLLTAIGLSPCGNSTVHIYTQTIHRTIQNKQCTEQHNN